MFANHLKDFIAGFNITVETIKEFLPHLSHKLDNFFYDANSFAEAYLSEYVYLEQLLPFTEYWRSLPYAILVFDFNFNPT